MYCVLSCKTTSNNRVNDFKVPLDMAREINKKTHNKNRKDKKGKKREERKTKIGKKKSKAKNEETQKRKEKKRKTIKSKGSIRRGNVGNEDLHRAFCTKRFVLGRNFLICLAMTLKR